MGELIAHLCGDYVIQNHWMANRKTSHSWVAGIHALTYTIPFLVLTHSPAALAVIVGTHFLIDRFQLAKYWVRFWGVGNPGWLGRKFNLDIPAAPDWLGACLLIIVDNTVHLAINHGSILWL